ncbi:Npun_R2821/Npun_R2822 family protein [Roseofilum casamattae]|uniref:Methionine synthase n=1 Tax=Roseofilum casamattae BLCC-M143 TaxID=3022442 RepID=A0ABT7C2I7_9CYAN|nr:Npun_R2821/Npun_R2822 family protein [Roseofilum casamattae]MDJ1185635.1 methionine synthase [Roseofilum casamattae BLCC-M143]
MTAGIYIVANDKVKENAIALLNSIRLRDREIPVYMIPFNEAYHDTAAILAEKHDVRVFPDLELLETFTQNIAEIFDRDFLALPNKMRKLVAWFGPLDEFLYIDTDIIIFEKISERLSYLSDYGFLCCDYHHSGRGINDIFSPKVIDQSIFTSEELQDVFNSGFWGSTKAALSEETMYSLLKECAAHRNYFDFSSNVTDQPILNYIILKAIPKRLNLVKLPEGIPGSWAGSNHFEERDRILYDKGKPLMYLHWAGMPMRNGGPYRELWRYYRYLGEANPPADPPAPKSEPQWKQKLRTLKKKLLG